MRRLWVLRHAKSSWDDPTLADHDRPLAPRGLKAARRIAGWADENGIEPELVLCSTAARARATLELVLPGLGTPRVEVEGALYHAPADELLARLRRVGAPIASVLLIGHNPGLHNLVGLLAPPGPEELPTGALVGLALDVEAWAETSPGCGRLEQLILPRTL